MSAPQQHRDLFRHVSETLIEFAAEVTQKSGGYLSPTDTARMLLAAGITVMARAIGRPATSEYLRAAATALERETTELNG